MQTAVYRTLSMGSYPYSSLVMTYHLTFQAPISCWHTDAALRFKILCKHYTIKKVSNSEMCYQSIKNY